MVKLVESVVIVLALLCASEAQKGVRFFICKTGLIIWLS